MKNKKAIVSIILILTLLISTISIGSVTTSAASTTPKIIKMETVSNGIKLTLNKVSGSPRYRIFIKSGNNWKKLGDTFSTSYIAKSLKYGKVYTFTVRCLTRDGKKYITGYNKTGYSLAFCASPKITKIEGVNNGTKLTWSRSAGAAKYRVFGKTGTTWKKIGDTASTSYVAPAKNGTTTAYTVRCITKNGGAYTSYFNTKGTAAQFNSVPVIKSISSTVDGLQVTWANNGAAKFRVFKKVNGKWLKIADTTKNTYLDTAVIEDFEYCYTIRCISNTGRYFSSGYNTAGTKAYYRYVAEPYVPVDLTKPVEPERPTEPPTAAPTNPVDPTVSANPTEPIDNTKFKPEITSKSIVCMNKSYYLAIWWKRIQGISTYAVYAYEGDRWSLYDETMQSTTNYKLTVGGDLKFAVIALDPNDDSLHLTPDEAAFTVKVRYVVDQEAYTYEYDITERVGLAVCNKCGASVEGYLKDYPELIDEKYANYLTWFYKVNRLGTTEPLSKEDFANQHTMYQCHWGVLGDCSSAYHATTYNKLIGTETIDYPEVGHYELGDSSVEPTTEPTAEPKYEVSVVYAEDMDYDKYSKYLPKIAGYKVNIGNNDSEIGVTLYLEDSDEYSSYILCYKQPGRLWHGKREYINNPSFYPLENEYALIPVSKATGRAVYLGPEYVKFKIVVNRID